MIMYYVTPMIPLYNGFYLFPLSRAVNSNRLIFDPSEFKIGLYNPFLVYFRELAPGTVSLTGDRAQGDDS